MILQIHFNSVVPVYQQIVEQIKRAAASGALRPGESLPTIRPLAEQLRVNRNTVAKAYAELESQGIIAAAAGKGCFLADNHSPLKKEVRNRLLAEKIDAAVVEAHHLQIPRDDFLKAVRERLDVFDSKRSDSV